MKVVLDPGAIMPTKAHANDAGIDLYAVFPAVIPPHKAVVFNTGVHIAIPRGYVGLLKSKSGLNVKHDITSDGVIDSRYTGSIRVKLYNHGDKSYWVRGGDKISQLVVVPFLDEILIECNKLDETERGENGFGSSGR